MIIALVVIISMISITIMKKSFFRLVPILISVTLGYVVAMFMGLVSFEPIAKANWIGLSAEAANDLFTLPHFSVSAVLAIAPIALVVFIEHIGDITTNGAVVGKDFFKNPGIHRTLMGDGVATIVAGLLGGPANTTYGENTGLLGKFGVILQTIPAPVMGGVSIILFGMISSVGARTLVDAGLDFSNSRNLIIASLIFVFGIAVDNIVIWKTVSLSGLALAALAGVVLNKVLPLDREVAINKKID